MEELLKKLKVKYIGELDNTIATIYLEDAIEYCVNFTRQTSSYMIEKLSSVIISIALENLSKRGAEGLKSQGYSGVSETYSEDASEAIKKQLRNHRRL